MPGPTTLIALSRRCGRGLDDKNSAPEILPFLHPGYDTTARFSAPQGTLVQVWHPISDAITTTIHESQPGRIL
jgi:hypothetical protein